MYKSGRKERTYDVAYTNGNVTSNTITPEPKRPQSWIPISDGDLHSVLDPISGMIFPATAESQSLQSDLAGLRRRNAHGSETVAEGITSVFDEWFQGQDDSPVASVSCRRAADKGTRKDYLYLAKSDGMEIWFAKADAMNVYAPVYVRIPTQYGTVTITAVKYGS